MENWVRETRRNRIIIIQWDIIKCRNQRLLVAQNLLEPWRGYLHFNLTCCSFFKKQSFFRRNEPMTETFINHLGKKGKVSKKIHKTTLQQKPVPQKKPQPNQTKKPKRWQHWWWHYFERARLCTRNGTDKVSRRVYGGRWCNFKWAAL